MEGREDADPGLQSVKSKWMNQGGEKNRKQEDAHEDAHIGGTRP